MTSIEEIRVSRTEDGYGAEMMLDEVGLDPDPLNNFRIVVRGNFGRMGRATSGDIISAGINALAAVLVACDEREIDIQFVDQNGEVHA